MANSTRPNSSPPSRLVLASTSRYRRALLDRLAIPFEVCGPLIDETPKPNETAIDLVHRLSRAKAQAVAERYPDSIIIGSDQVAVNGRDILGKPGTVDRCCQQLQEASGRRVLFHTGVHVIDQRHRRDEAYIDTTTVQFRVLKDEEITRYVQKENPLDCAGGFKVEALGICLFDRIDSQDPTALTGLPLIWLAGALRRAGLAIP
jgi:septum formation protein